MSFSGGRPASNGVPLYGSGAGAAAADPDPLPAALISSTFLLTSSDTFVPESGCVPFAEACLSTAFETSGGIFLSNSSKTCDLA